MKLLYATSIDVPSTRANRLQVISMADAFYRKIGNDFVLGISDRAPEYELSLPLYVVGRAPSWLLAYRYMQFAKKNHVDTIYCREEYLLFFMMVLERAIFKLGIRFEYEVHHLSYLHAPWYRQLLRRVSGIISLTHGTAEILMSKGVPQEKILIAGDAVNIERFENPLTKAEARTELGLPLDVKIIVYIGTIHEPWKGVGTLYDATLLLPEDVLTVIVGGKPHYVEEFNTHHPPRATVRLVGHQNSHRVPLYLSAADVAVLPNSGKEEISRIATSPMKLFEYMAANVPVVASDLPSIREVIDSDSAILVTPDDPRALSVGIMSLLQDTDLSRKLAESARRRVATQTWYNRADRIVSFIQAHA